MNSHHPDPPAAVFLVGFSYEFLVAFLQIHHLRVKLQTSRTQQQEPAVKQQKNMFFIQELDFFHHVFPPTGPQVLVQDLCSPRSRGLQVEWGKSMPSLFVKTKHIRCIQKCDFSSRKPPPHWFMRYMPTPNWATQTSWEASQLLASPNSQSGWIC